MAKLIIPQVAYRDLDLADYGGEGKLRVFGLTVKSSEYISSTLKKLALEDGYSRQDLINKAKEIDAVYAIPTMMLMVEQCAKALDEDGKYRALTAYEIDTLPPKLSADICEIATELNDFPLVQKDGEESKKEQSKPTSVE